MKRSEYSFEELIHDESFGRWVYGESNLEEKKYWDQWVEKDPNNRRLALRAQKKIAGFSIEPLSRPNRRRAWDQLEENLDKTDNRPEKQFYDLHPKSGLQWVFRIAAVFLVVAATGLVVHFMNKQVPQKKAEQIVRNEVVTKYGERKTIKLNDGSKIILNAHSNLVYTMDRADSNSVEVFLDGEAHFSVAERENPGDAPFKVRTPEGFVKVMGTTFVVSTRNQDTRVVLEEGKVSLSPSNKDEKTIMGPGQLAVFGANSSTVQTRHVNTKVYTSWRTPMLVFDQTPLTDLIDRLENTFGVKVVVRELDLFNRRISGSIDNASLEIITNALSNTLDTPIEVTDTAVYVGKRFSNKN